MIVIDSAKPDAERFLKDYEILKKYSEGGKLPFQIYLNDEQVVGFGIEEPDREGFSRSRKPAYALIPVMASPVSLSEFTILGLEKARQKGLGYVHSIIEADKKEVISSLEKGGLKILDEYFLMSRGLEDVEYVNDPVIDFDRVTEGNVEFFMRTFYEAFKDSPDRLVAMLFQKTETATLEIMASMKEFFTRPDHYTYIIKYHGEPAGILATGKTLFNAIGLLPQYRGRGIGRQSMLFALSELRQRGQKTISLRVDVRNIPAIRLYKRLGFKVVEHKIRLFKPLE